MGVSTFFKWYIWYQIAQNITFEAQFMKMLIQTEAELRKSIAYKRYGIATRFPP